MNDTPDDTLPRRKRKRKRAARRSPTDAAPAEPAVQALLEQALHPDPAALEEVEAAAPARKRRPPRKRGRKAEASTTEASVAAATALPTADPVVADGKIAPEAVVDAAAPASSEDPGPGEMPPEADPVRDDEGDAPPPDAPLPEAPGTPDGRDDVPEGGEDRSDHDQPPDQPGYGRGDDEHHGHHPGAHDPHGHDAYGHDHHTGGHDGYDDGSAGQPPIDHDPPAVAEAVPASHHHWVYLAVAVFLLAIGFGLWGVWLTFFADAGADQRSLAALRARTEKLSQEAATLRRSDQISRDANRDLERTLAERDEEIAGLRADVAFYESFVGATGQRRGLSVHDLDMRLQGGDVWQFVATLTQNVNRGAVNSGRITLSLEGTRNDKLERLSWSALRKQKNAPGLPYSFKYFQQVEGELMLPKGFKPLRVSVRLVPQGGSAIEQSFAWPDTVAKRDGG